jgi:thioredoxin reductase (NADPH)
MSQTDSHYDVIIIGGGPAGLSSALYTSRDRYRTLILEKNGLPGGQIMLTDRIENYPGYEKISGPGLVENMTRQVHAFGAETKTSREVSALRREADGTLVVEVDGGDELYTARSVILAPGSDYRQLNVPGEAQMRQAGKVSYCATCDGAFYRDKHVMTVGGGNTAVEDTLYLTKRFVARATLVHRREEFRAQQVLVEELMRETQGGKVDLKLPYILTEIVPTDDGAEIDHVRLQNVATEAVEEMKVDGVFVFVGMVPNTKFLEGAVRINEHGYIACDCTTLKTSLPGVFVAGDCRQQAAMQLATACGDGVIAAMMVKEYFKDPSSWPESAGADGLTSGW